MSADRAFEKPKAIWVRPRILVDVEYRAVTDDGRLRHASFKGLREHLKRRIKLPRVGYGNPPKHAQFQLHVWHGTLPAYTRRATIVLNTTATTNVKIPDPFVFDYVLHRRPGLVRR
jgi:hypothetical protein